MVKHICDTRCLNEDHGHHAWPSPQPGECLCGQEVMGKKVWCPVHNRSVDKDERTLIGGHKQGCPATGGYGHGVEECICGASRIFANGYGSARLVDITHDGKDAYIFNHDTKKTYKYRLVGVQDSSDIRDVNTGNIIER